MAKFKVGDKARIIDAPDMRKKHWIGCEVTILQLPGWLAEDPDHYQISRPAAAADSVAARFAALGHHLAPLTDPGVDAFMERIKRLANEPNNEVSKEGKPHMVRFVKETGE